MIELFWTKCTVLIPILLSFIGASWMIGKHKDDMQKKYKDEIKEMNSIVYSSKIVPLVVELLEESNKEKMANSESTYEDILAGGKYLGIIKKITESENIISDIRFQYESLQNSLSLLSNYLMYEGLWFFILSFYYVFDIGQMLPNYNSVIFIIIIMIFIFILSIISSHYGDYKNTKESLSGMYDKIVIETSTIEGVD
jgi:hypothetical protein